MWLSQDRESENQVGDLWDFNGSKTYKIHLPPNVPVKDFWSFTLYDSQTRSMLQTDQRFPGVDNLGKGWNTILRLYGPLRSTTRPGSPGIRSL